MTRFRLFLMGAVCTFAGNAFAQTVFTGSEHVIFDSPEGWALKYFTSASMMSGLQPPEPLGEHLQVGSITLGLESGWLPTLSPARADVGFGGTKEEDVNKAPVFVRPSVRIGLPWRMTVVVAGPPPVEAFGVTPHLFAVGLERPLLEGENWSLTGRLSGQFGSVQGAFTCPQKVLAFAAGSPQNPTGCLGQSADQASLRYGGAETQFAYRIPRLRRLIPHAAIGGNYINTSFHVDAPLTKGIDRTMLWTAGNTVTGSAGVSYLLTNRLAVTVDAFYTPLFIRRGDAGGRTNDGLFNVRALVSYRLR